MNSLKSKIESEIKKKNWSVHALERQAGLKPSAIQNILRDRSKNPSISMIQAIASALGCSITDLIDENENKDKKNDKTELYKNTYSWDQPLFCACMQEFLLVISQEQIYFTDQAKICEIINKLYNYCCMNDLKKPDRNFLKWLFETC